MKRGARYACGTQTRLLTVASFRTWRGSQDSVAQGPAPSLKKPTALSHQQSALNLPSELACQPKPWRRLAERVGFEPTVPLPAHVLSRHAESAALAPLRVMRLLPFSRRSHLSMGSLHRQAGEAGSFCAILSATGSCGLLLVASRHRSDVGMNV